MTEGWAPSKGWASTIAPAYATLNRGDATWSEEAAAWAQVAMMLGDTHAPELGLLVTQHAQARLPAGVEDRRLRAHEDLFLLDLGLGRAATPHVAIKELGEPGTVEVSGLDAWLIAHLARFDGSLERAAWFALRLAAERTGVT